MVMLTCVLTCTEYEFSECELSGGTFVRTAVAHFSEHLPFTSEVAGLILSENFLNVT